MTVDVYSGRMGAVANSTSVLQAISDWSVSYKSEPNAIVDSSTAGGNTRVIGNTDWSGKYTANGATPAFLLFPTFNFIGSIDGTYGVHGTAIVDSVRINWDIAGGKEITHEVSFSGNGTLSKGSAAAVDASAVVPETSLLGADCVQYATPTNPISSQSWASLPGVQTITLELKRANTNYTDGSTAGVVLRKPGPLDWTLSLKLHPNATLNSTAISSLPQPNAVYGFRLLTDATNGYFYELDWGIVDSVSDLSLNRKTQEIVSVSINAAMCGTTLLPVSGTALRGQVLSPGAAPTILWPVSPIL